MGDGDMEAFDECFHRQLPVARQDLGDVDRLPPGFQFEPFEMLGQDFEIAIERFGIVGQVDEDEAAPFADMHFGQVPLVPIDMFEIPRARHMRQLAVERPGEAVERAAERLHAAARFAQQDAPMQADVHEGADAFGRAGDQDRLVADLIDDMVADVRDLLDPAGHLPDLLPHMLHFQIVPFAGEIAFDRNVAGVGGGWRGFEAQDIGRWPHVLRQDFLHGRARALAGGHVVHRLVSDQKGACRPFL